MRVENGNLIRSKRHLFPCFITVLYLLQVGRGWERRVFYWWWVPDWVGGGGKGEGLLKTWIFRSATHMERGDDFELFCMRQCQLFERWIALFTWWISIHWIAQSIFWTIGAWSIKDYLYGQKRTFSCGPTREVPNEQDAFILPAGVANQNTFFASSCPLMNSAI